MRTFPLVAGCLLITQVSTVTADYPVAGVEPSLRPAGAPSTKYVKHDKAWYRHALTGVVKPYPRSLYFLDNQGYWHTPFINPGMPGRYDIRGWHK